LHERTAEILTGFGYGLPDCRVWRYWDDAQPVKTEGAPAKVLTLALGGKALLAVCSYGPGGDVLLTLDTRRLKLAKDASAVNAETGESVERLASGQFRIALPRHDFRLLTLQGDSPVSHINPSRNDNTK